MDQEYNYGSLHLVVANFAGATRKFAENYRQSWWQQYD
jgi:hypothetical protein